MSQRIVFELLKHLDKPSDIDEIFDAAKKENIKKANDRVKIRDALILLTRKGYVKESNGKWTILSEMPEP